MLNKFLGVLALTSLTGMLWPSAFDAYRREMQANEEVVEAPPTIVEARHPAAEPAPRTRTARLEARPDGHFTTDARINGRTVPVLVDTGATFVALSRETAQRLGAAPRPEDFRFRVSTANGETRAARVVLSRVEIGAVAVSDVEAFVMDGLPTSLLGMSFLGRLSRFEVTAGRLNLTE